jgi:hypothetical protein
LRLIDDIWNLAFKELTLEDPFLCEDELLGGKLSVLILLCVQYCENLPWNYLISLIFPLVNLFDLIVYFDLMPVAYAETKSFGLLHTFIIANAVHWKGHTPSLQHFCPCAKH